MAARGRSDLFQAGAFMRHNVGAAYLAAALAYGWQDVTTDRTVRSPASISCAPSSTPMRCPAALEGGYRFVTPASASRLMPPDSSPPSICRPMPNRRSSGANTFALSYARQERHRVAQRAWACAPTDPSRCTDAILTLRGRAAWAHDFNTDRNIAATFQTLPGASFVVNGAAQAPDAALTTASAEMKWLNGFSVAATFEGEFSDVTESYAGKGVVRYAW